jgi:hypothetical protein
MGSLTHRIATSAYAWMGHDSLEHIAGLVERDFEAITYHRLARWG